MVASDLACISKCSIFFGFFLSSLCDVFSLFMNLRHPRSSSQRFHVRTRPKVVIHVLMLHLKTRLVGGRRRWQLICIGPPESRFSTIHLETFSASRRPGHARALPGTSQCCCRCPSGKLDGEGGALALSVADFSPYAPRDQLVVEIITKGFRGAEDDEGEDASGYAWNEALDVCNGVAGM